MPPVSKYIEWASFYVICAAMVSVFLIAATCKGIIGCILGATVFVIVFIWIFVQSSIKKAGSREKHGTKYYWVVRDKTGDVISMEEMK